MRGGLKVFWNVSDRSNGANMAQALARGFEPVTLLNTFADYPGDQKQNIAHFVGRKNKNPWKKPPYFKDIIQRNIAQRENNGGIFVNDIEIGFEQEAARAWADETARKYSGHESFSTFEAAYYQEWATWFWQPAKWTKQQYPNQPTGLYGPQAFRRDYWGISGKSAQQIDGTHANDHLLWQHIDPYIDFYVASIYVFYNQPGSVYYMAANVEENFARTRQFGNKPVYAYEWLRYHNSNKWENNRELDPYLVEAMAIIPFFSGAKGIVLWGHEVQIKSDETYPFDNLPLFVSHVKRVARLSDKIGRARLEIDTPAHVLWKSKRPLVRQMIVKEGECIVMAVNPWQSEQSESRQTIQCGTESAEVTMRGQRVTLLHINRRQLTEY